MNTNKILLTKTQHKIIVAVCKKNNVLISGPGGTGKTEIIKYIKNLERELITPGMVMGSTALTGTAAVLIKDTFTLHSYLGIGLGKGSVNDIKEKLSCEKIKLLQSLQILIIDEISMLSDELFDKIEQLARIVRNNKKPFGGIQIILSGDFLQLPCINGNFCFKAKSWQNCNFQIFCLKKIIRQNDVIFQQILNRARFGLITDNDVKYLKENSKNTDSDVPNELEIQPTRILCKNVDVENINLNSLDSLKANQVYKYTQKLTLLDKHEKISQYNNIYCSAPKELYLSEGAQVMLCINLNLSQELVNGSRGIVVGFKKTLSNKNLPIVKFLNCTITIEYYEYEIFKKDQHNNEKKVASITQIPLKLAYAITVHKSMGMTIDCAHINLKGVFEYGQAYVALSRAKTLNCLVIENLTKESFLPHPDAIEFYQKLEL